MLVFILEALAPTVASALTSGPSQPEFSGFEPVGTTGLVNEATGGFSYSIPVIQVPGPGGSTYPLTLSYHSNVGVEEDASWVGYGWTLNAGAINRNVRGIPDDINGDKVIQYHSQPMDETYSVGNTVKPQVASIDVFEFERAVTYNTRAGYSIVSGMSLNVGNMLALNIRRENGRMRYGVRPNWANIFSTVASDWSAEKSKSQQGKEVASISEMRRVIQDGISKRGSDRASMKATMFAGVANYIAQTYASPMPAPTNPVQYNGADYLINFGATIAIPGLPIVAGGHGGARGTYSVRRFAGLDPNAPANTGVAEYGYMYQNGSLNDAGATSSMDYSVQSESAFNTRDRYISPAYTGHDLFNASGQGVSGTFRLWQMKPGAYRPREVANTMVTAKVDLEAGLSIDKISFGTTAIGVGYNITTIKEGATIGTDYRHEGADRTLNAVFARMNNDPADEVQYFQSPLPEHGFSTTNNYATGVYPNRRINNAASNLDRPRSSTTIQFRTNDEMVYFQRPRTMPITNTVPTSTGLTRSAALSLGNINSGPSASKNIWRGDLPIGSNKYNYRHRIGEMAVTTSSGTKYVYGQPVYSCDERNLQFMGRRVSDGSPFWNRFIHDKRLKLTDKSAQVSGTYRAVPYASSHLLTAVQTPDYVDVKSDGLTEDDLGGWTAFSYRQVAGGSPDQKRNWYRWRIPYTGFHYQAGSHTTGVDDRASVASGYREMYYLEKVETKTHIAYFITNKTKVTISSGGGPDLVFEGSKAERRDAWEAYNEFNDYDRNEEVSAEWQDRQLLPALYAGSQHASLMGKLLGGRRSPWNPWVNPENPASPNTPVSDALGRKNKSEYLERIVLVAKKPGGGHEVLQTVNLEYTYELQEARPEVFVKKTEWNAALEQEVTVATEDEWDSVYAAPGRLNSSIMFTSDEVNATHTAERMNARRFGKLTLKRLWTDFGAAKRADIAPYEFEYLYRDHGKNGFADPIGANPKLASVREFGNDYSFRPIPVSDPGNKKYDSGTAAIQNPKYDPIAADPWGMYRSDGGDAAQAFRSHLNQRQQGGAGFDPAAWQLKIIRLPSGGEIHVQYEANTYAFVQDQPAMAFVQLKGVENVDGQYVYELKLDSDVSGLNGMSAAEVADRIKAYIRDYRQRIYFKFLAKVQPSAVQPTDGAFPFAGVDYITGHSNVSETDVVTWTTGPDNRVGLKFNDDYSPKDLAKEFALTHRLGYAPNVTRKSQYGRRFQYRNMSESMTQPDSKWLLPAEVGVPDEALMNALMQSASGINKDIGDIEALFQNEPLRPVNKFSYIRIPCGSKRGSGVRVKRIVMYDSGIEPGTAALYGNEYLYETTVDGRTVSSGVVTNEPSEIRDESALTTFLAGRNDQNFLNRLASGDDLEQMEGPLCANAYPAPQLIYSRVVTRPILHEVTSAPGFVISEFNTARDYPVKVEATTLDPEGIDLPPISPAGSPLSISGGSKTLAQGYTVTLNAMHGTPKRVTSYGGRYAQPETWTIAESTEFEYFEPGEGVSILEPATDEGNGYPGKITSGVHLGRDIDVALETRLVKNEYAIVDIPFDLGLLFVAIIPTLFGHVGMPKASISTQQLTLRTITKIVSTNVLPKRTVTTRDGMVHVEENLVFDAQSGKPCIVRSYDEMFKAYQTTTSSVNSNTQQLYTVPASLVYPEMRNKSFNDMLTVPCTTDVAVPPVSSGAVKLMNVADRKYLLVGDLIRIGMITSTPLSSNGRFYHITAYGPGSDEITVKELSIGGSATPPYSGQLYVTVIESGRTQQLDAQAGSILRYGNGVAATNTLSPLANVIKASAVTYDDTWPNSLTSATATDYELGKRGKWRPKDFYTWKSSVYSVFDASSPMRGNYENGYASSFTGFPYGSSPAAPWTRISTVNAYDTNGLAIAETDALNVPSTATFTREEMLPSMIARNAQKGTIFFNGFEPYDEIDPSGVVSLTSAHTGRRSLDLGTSEVPLATMQVNNLTGQKGIVMQYWVKSTDPNPVTVTIDGTVRTSTKVAHAGEWALFQVTLSHTVVHAFPLLTYPVTIKSNGGTVAVDDVRIQPETSEATCYVYDSGLRLIAQFDDRHFASLYQYTPEGRLAYRKRETERGIMTVEERQYNTPRTNRTLPDGGITPGALVMRASGRRVFNGPAVPVGMGMPGQPAAIGAKGSVLDLKVSPTRRTIRLFDGDTTNVPDLDSLRRSVDTLMNKNGKESR